MNDLRWIHVTGPHGDGVVCEQGAHVADWTPAEHAPVLFLSGASRMEPGSPIRGGVPVIFPWFGEDPEDRGRPAHGFARRLPWDVVETAEGPDGVRVSLQLADDEETRRMWPHRFALRLEAVFGAALEMSLRVENRDDAPLRFEEALHTYLAVGDVREAKLRGLEGTTYVDKLDGFARRTSGDEPLVFDREIDRVYLGTDATCRVDDPVLGRTLTVAKEGSRSTVVWNPWIDKAARLDDLDDDDWMAMLCVESGNVADDAITLAPGESHVIRVTITAA